MRPPKLEIALGPKPCCVRKLQIAGRVGLLLQQLPCHRDATNSQCANMESIDSATQLGSRSRACREPGFLDGVNCTPTLTCDICDVRLGEVFECMYL
eukprot:4262180-Amphidinium_carterae.1